MAGRIFNGQSWTDVVESDGGHTTGNQSPVLPILNGDGSIFVSIVSFRDGVRCGKTIADIFAKAKNPEKVMIGLVDQSAEEDSYCLEAYCQEVAGVKIYRKANIRQDTIKVIENPDQKQLCPHIDQIRKLSVYNIAAKGPVYARALTRKVLGNEEFCLQIDSHSSFVQDWDDVLKHQWAATGNEFAIISTPPPSMDDTNNADSVHTVSRPCSVKFLEIGIPSYKEDGKVENLQKPLLSHTWSPGFSFSKCHLEETAPYDPFTPYIMGAEAFGRYARFWTRGYDVYTPTQNIVYHDTKPNPDGHGINEWSKPRFARFRKESVSRIKSYLNLPDGSPKYDRNLANLGLYGLGKRRTLKQLADFVGIDLESQTSRDPGASCGNFHWVPYDANISPVENLWDAPDDLDPQPEYDLRTELTFYSQEEMAAAEGDLDKLMKGDFLDGGSKQNNNNALAVPTTESSPFPSAILILTLWILGLVLWFSVFVAPPSEKKQRIVKKSQSLKDK